MSARVKQTGMLHNSLGVQRTSLPVVGKIRPGIKVPTSKASAIAAVKQAYRDGVAAGATYDDIALAMKNADKNCPDYPLTPKNAPYFRVHLSDFFPGIAERIMDLYATKRDGDTEPHLYSFPVVFPSDDIDLVFREQFEAWQRSSILRWSEADPETGESSCMKRQDAAPDANRRKRWGGRASERIGPCEPNNCDLFGAGHCKHMGSLYFWIPGVPGAGVFELEFTSVYASLGIIEILEPVMIGLGRIRGTLNGKSIFTISKKMQSVSVMDWGKGTASRQNQYIIQLDASGIDMTKVMASQEGPMLKAPVEQARIEKEPRFMPIDNPNPGEVTEIPGNKEMAPVSVVQNNAKVVVPVENTAPEPKEEKTTQMSAKVKSLRRDITKVLKTLQWSNQELEDLVVGSEKWGSVESLRDENHLQEILDALINELPST